MVSSFLVRSTFPLVGWAIIFSYWLIVSVSRIYDRLFYLYKFFTDRYYQAWNLIAVLALIFPVLLTFYFAANNFKLRKIKGVNYAELFLLVCSWALIFYNFSFLTSS